MPAVRSRVPRCLLALALCGCPQKTGDTAADPTTTGATTSTTTGSTSGGPTTSGATNTTGSTGDTTTSGTSGGDPESVCDPQPEAVRADFVIDGEEFFSDDLEYVHRCTVAALSRGDSLVLELSGCKTNPDDPAEPSVTHTVDVGFTPAGPIDLAVGDEVVLSVIARYIFWTNWYFTLRRPTSELVLAGLRGNALPGGPSSPPVDFFAPFTIERVVTCPLEPIPPPEPSGFIMNEPCYQLRRETMRLQWSGGATVDQIDHSAQLWPDEPYRVVVERAEFHEDLGNCSDQTSAWFEATILRTTE